MTKCSAVLIAFFLFPFLGFGQLYQQNWRDYVPSPTSLEWMPIKTVRINIHFVSRSDGSGNFDEGTGRKFARDLVAAANGLLANNQPMNLPKGNATPVLPIQIRYELAGDSASPDGIYFIRSDSDYRFNRSDVSTIFDPSIFEKNGKQKGKVLNVFLFENTDGSGKTGGIGAGDWAKVGGLFYHFKNYQRWAWFGAGLFNHEIGHSLGLFHTWNENDGCDDTPMNDNCWNVAEEGPCKHPSNNVMDYNANENAWTPCQIGKVHLALSNPGIPRDFLVPDHRVLEDSLDVFLPPGDTLIISGNRFLRGDLILGRRSVLIVRNCKIVLPTSGRLIQRRKSIILYEQRGKIEVTR
jgi:hypothetical protein